MKMLSLSIAQFAKKCEEHFKFSLVAGETGLDKPLKRSQVERPGLALTGYLKGFDFHRLLVFGKEEINYLKDLDPEMRLKRLSEVLLPSVPAIFLSKRAIPMPELEQLASERAIALFRTSLEATVLVNRLGTILKELSAPTSLCHGTLVEVFGLGVFIQGNSSVGKSEAALGLIERRHRLIADDVVKVQRKENGLLIGTGMSLGKHIMEIRGIGIINVAHLYGAVCVREEHSVDLVVYLEAWDDAHSYERIGLEEKSCDILDCAIPFYVLPVKPGRDVVLLLETIVLNHRLKKMGIHSAKEFSLRLTDEMRKKEKSCESCL
jgi:HPr kinase/phosphorylase